MYKSLTIVALIVFFLADQVSANSHTDPDFNDDGIVDKGDLRLLIANWATREDGPNWESKYDLHSDGVINKLDLRILISNWGKTFPVPLSERDILVTLYNATGGLDWTNKTNWLSNNDISTWHGVSVSNGLVTGLDLSQNNLMGKIPAELCNLTNLDSLKLGDNQLSGSIPPELGDLTNLRYLVLTGNQLSGSIPPALGKLTKLEELHLSFNKLSGPIPAKLGDLSSLKQLWLVNNQLSGSIPPDLGKLANLEFLIITNDPLSGALLSGRLPRELTSLTKLTRFLFGIEIGIGTGIWSTDLCAPLDTAFQEWLQDITEISGQNCSS